MKKLNLDFFKLIITLMLIWIAFSIHNFSKNGRYVLNNDSDLILDTRSGTLYYPNDKPYFEITR